MSFLNWLLRRKPPPEAASLGRNKPCWCGSGKKYKQCHYETDKEYFARNRPASCGPT